MYSGRGVAVFMDLSTIADKAVPRHVFNRKRKQYKSAG